VFQSISFGRQEQYAREKMQMKDDGNDSTGLVDEPYFNLPPPRFDESATAHAQPVQPIRASRASGFYDRFVSLGRALTSGYRALVLVVIAGLVAGTVGGMAWFEGRRDVQPTANELSVAQENPQNEEPRAEVSGVTNLQNAGLTTSQSRKGRWRTRSNRAPRAYRVAVLR
jgi:hypothetical protein